MHKIKHGEKIHCSWNGLVFLKTILALPNKNWPPLLPTCSAHHSVFNLCPWWGGCCSKPSILGLGSQELSGAQTLSNSNTETYSVFGNPSIQDVSQKVTKGQTAGGDSSLSARQRGTAPRPVGVTIPTPFFGNICQLGCTGKGQCKCRGLLQISQRGWSLMGKYHVLFL